MIDTHAHIYLPDYSNDFSAMVDRAIDTGIRHILMPAINPDSVAQMEVITHLSSNKNNINLHPMIGLHPCEVMEQISIWGEKFWPRKLEGWLLEFAGLNQNVGIGETGLDYYWSMDSKEAVSYTHLRAHET